MAAAEFLSRTKYNSIADFYCEIDFRKGYIFILSILHKYFRGRSIWVSVLGVNSGCIALPKALCNKELKDIEGKSSRGTLRP